MSAQGPKTSYQRERRQRLKQANQKIFSTSDGQRITPQQYLDEMDRLFKSTRSQRNMNYVNSMVNHYASVMFFGDELARGNSPLTDSRGPYDNTDRRESYGGHDVWLTSSTTKPGGVTVNYRMRNMAYSNLTRDQYKKETDFDKYTINAGKRAFKTPSDAARFMLEKAKEYKKRSGS